MATSHHTHYSLIRTDSVTDIRASVAALIDCHYRATGVFCTQPQALAALYSVPDGATIEFAELNVGVALSDNAARHYEAMRAGLRAFCKYATRG